MTKSWEEEGRSARTEAILHTTTGKGQTKGQTSDEAEKNSEDILRGLKGQTPVEAIRTFNATNFEQRKK